MLIAAMYICEFQIILHTMFLHPASRSLAEVYIMSTLTVWLLMSCIVGTALGQSKLVFGEVKGV